MKVKQIKVRPYIDYKAKIINILMDWRAPGIRRPESPLKMDRSSPEDLWKGLNPSGYRGWI